MKNSELDLVIAGNAYSDLIFEVDKEPRQSWGGIYNVARSFKDLAPRKRVEVYPSVFGVSTILVDRVNATKDVNTSPNVAVHNVKLPPAKWTHIAYANALPDYSFQNDIKIPSETIISFDLCKGKDFYYPYKVDYIFASTDEHNVGVLSYRFPYTKIIAHNSSGAAIYKDTIKKCSYNVAKRKNINILGAGDFFAAAFINNRLDGLNDDKSLSLALDKMSYYFEYN
jgi:hypothetical protein